MEGAACLGRVREAFSDLARGAWTMAGTVAAAALPEAEAGQQDHAQGTPGRLVTVLGHGER